MQTLQGVQTEGCYQRKLEANLDELLMSSYNENKKNHFIRASHAYSQTSRARTCHRLEANNKTLHITDWLVWFAGILLQAQRYSLELIGHTIAKTKMLDQLRGQLNTRQEKALLRMFAAGPEGFIGGLSANNYLSITETTPATARRDLVDLVTKGALTRTGTRKGTRYWLNIQTL